MATEAGQPDCAAIIISSLQATSERQEDHRRQGARGPAERLCILTLMNKPGRGELIWQERGRTGLREGPGEPRWEHRELGLPGSV